MTWYEERRLGWTKDTGDRLETWTLKRFHESLRSAEAMLKTEFKADSVPFPAGSLGNLTRSHLREVACIFEEEKQWTYIQTVRAFYYLNRTLLKAKKERDPRKVRCRIKKLGERSPLVLVLFMRTHFVAVTFKARTGELRFTDLARDVEEIGTELIESIDHIGKTLASRFYAEKFVRTEGLVSWAMEVGLLDILVTLRERIQAAAEQSAAVLRQPHERHRALEPQKGNLPDTFYAAFDRVAHLLRPEGRKNRMAQETKELFRLIDVKVNLENEHKALMRRTAKRNAESACSADVDEP